MSGHDKIGFAYTVGQLGFTVTFETGESVTVSSTHPEYHQMLAALRNEDLSLLAVWADPEARNTLERLFKAADEERERDAQP